MSDQSQPTSEQPIPQTPTGEIKNQSPPPTPSTAETKPPETKEKPTLLNEQEKEAPKGAPDKYEEFKVPDGFELDEDVAKEAGNLFKSSGLNQADAQKFVDFYIAKTKEAFDSPFRAWAEMQETWINEVKADPVLGSRLPEVRSTISKAIDGLGDAKLASDFRSAM